MKTGSATLLHWTLCAILLALGCDDGGGLVGVGRLMRDDLVGSYVATTFIVTFGGEEFGGEEFDVLDAEGGWFITLEPAGTTTGTVIFFGEEVPEDLSGTWEFQREGPTVTLGREANSFVSDLTFHVECADDGTIQLRTDEVVGDNRFRIVLSRVATVQFPDTACP